MKRGRKETSVKINGSIIKEILASEEKSISELAKEIRYDRSGVSTAINKNWMDEKMLDAISQKLNVAPSLIKETLNHWEPIYDIPPEDFRALIWKAFEAGQDVHGIATQHYLGESDDPEIPIKYKYKYFPYEYEKYDNLNEVELLKQLCSAFRINTSLLTEEDFLILTVKAQVNLMQLVTEVERKSLKKYAESVQQKMDLHRGKL